MAGVALVGLAVVIQMAAMVCAVRLNFRYGRRWSWSFISFGLLVMAVSRCMTFYRLIGGDLTTSEVEAETASAVTSIATLVSSSCLLIGILLIEPLFRAINEIQRDLHQDRDRLVTSLATAESDLSVAQLIQSRLFPADDFKGNGLTISGRCLPMRFAGGDYFDYFPLPDGDTLIVVADVSGHGVGSAILMAELRACLRTAARQSHDPAFLMSESNQMIADFAVEGRFATSFLAVIHTAEQELSYIGAGHESWLIREDGSVESVGGGFLPLGINVKEPYLAKRVGFSPFDLLLLATDGIFEATDENGKSFGIARALDSVTGQRSQSPREIVGHLLAEVAAFRGNAELQDDITAVVVKFQA